ncbi:hypothetical protein EVAR_72564_1 [Eumeta japonica]|uniref:Uncharacterized protein n=1 Tax=Eumeta variegata TaxID=151549 RepID=A0A4C1T3K9_EUMVA|nr:hypothetical protein EVAR_72564_1 [Eumeta japonica]
MFAPGELMQSKLINDEISWAQEYAAIPTATLSDPNFSLGKFFNKRSDNIWDIVKSKSPDKCHTPVALVDEDDNTATVNHKVARDSVTKSDSPNAIEEILENKENLDPCQKRASGVATALGDTISFTESLLNSSDMKNLQRSFTQPRSPLSPINVPNQPIRVTEVADDGVDADNDDWPGTPINSDRRIRRKKSPRDKSPLKTSADEKCLQDATTPVI